MFCQLASHCQAAVWWPEARDPSTQLGGFQLRGFFLGQGQRMSKKAVGGFGGQDVPLHAVSHGKVFASMSLRASNYWVQKEVPV